MTFYNFSFLSENIKFKNKDKFNVNKYINKRIDNAVSCIPVYENNIKVKKLSKMSHINTY